MTASTYDRRGLLREGVGVASRLLNDPRPEVLCAVLVALKRMRGRGFGLPSGRRPTPEELRDAVVRAQRWCIEPRR